MKKGKRSGGAKDKEKDLDRTQSSLGNSLGNANVRCNVVVTVRVRPIVLGLGSRREEEAGEFATCVNVKDGKQITIEDPTDRGLKKRSFTYDYAFDSLADRSSPAYASQESVFNDLGVLTLTNAFQGYNTCIFAYGQTSSGKTYTMFGHEAVSLYAGDGTLHPEVGLIPRICDALFEKITNESEVAAQQGFPTSYRVETSYFEIYNEKVHDLLGSNHDQTYRVREHPTKGPYVEGLAKHEVRSYGEIEKYLKRGARSRHTASTNMNNHSSRSHAVCEIIVTCSKFDVTNGDIQETVSKMELVDLAGSERTSIAGTEGERLKEGTNINRSLLTLGNVIESLASRSEKTKKEKLSFVQYRDSTLTWLLREALGGNSKTIMIAALSPSSLNYEESLSTLKYADRAKKIQNKAHVNRDSKKALILNLREEVSLLRAELQKYKDGLMAPVGVAPGSPTNSIAVPPMGRRMSTSCGMLAEDTETSLISSGLFINKNAPYLLQTQPLPALHEAVVFWIEEGSTYISSTDLGVKDVHVDPMSMDDLKRLSYPLISANHTIFLQRTKGIVPYHAMIHREGNSVTIFPTYGKAFAGANLPSNRSDGEAETSIFVDGEAPDVNGEALICGQTLKIGSYEFVHCDPQNVDEMVAFNHMITKIEKAKAVQITNRRNISKRLQKILTEGNLAQTELLPEEKLVHGSYNGETQIVRSPHGPVVVVWNEEEGTWDATEDVFQAELTAMQAVDEKRRKTEVGLRLAAVLGASAAGELPAEEDVVKSVPQDPTKREKLMVRSPRTGGVKVLEWLPDEQKWKVASDTAAEQTVQAAAEKSAEKNHKSSEQEREQIGELKRIVASLTEQVAAKDKMLMGHKSEVATELKRYREKHEALIVEYDTKKLEFENIRDVLETNIMEVEYRLEAAESMHELCLAAKEKAITKLSNLQSENTQLENELRELTMELNRTKAERDELFISQTKLENLEKKMKEETSQRKSLSLAPERQLEEKVESMEEQLKLVEEGRTQAEDNLRRLSLQYTELKQELLERESRLSNYREALEEKERLIGDLENRKADFARSFEQCEARVDRQREENQVLLKKLMDHDQVTVQQQQMQKRLEALEADLEQSKNKTQSGDRRNVELTAQKQHLHNQVKAALEKCNSARAEVEELAEAVEQSRRSEKQLKDENSKMQDQLRIFRQSSPGQNQEMIDLSVRLELAEKQNLKLAADYQAHRRFTKDMMEGGHQKLKDELADAKTSLDKLESKLYKTEKRLVDAQSRAERERSAREEKDEEISYLKQELYQARGGEDSKTTDMSRKTNPFGTALGSSASEHKKTPRESRPRPSKHTPSYMKKTANWTAKTGDETRSSSPSKIVGESPRRLDSSLKRTNSRTKLPKK